MLATIKNCYIIILLSFFLGSFNFANCQQRKTKSITEIAFDYSLIGFGGNVRIDSTVILFDTLGNEINKNTSVEIGNVKWLISETVLASNENFKHTRNLFSDSSFHDVFHYNYKDSTIEYTLLNRDTIFKTAKYYKGKKLRRTVTERFPKGYYWADYEDEIILKNNIFKKQILETTSKTVDTNFIKKITFNKISKTKKTYLYNSFEKEWYLSEKLRFRKYEVHKFYHDYFKKYFGTKTRFKYNKYGDLISETTRSLPYRTLEKKVIRIYEYYN